ncbi:MAG: ABC transporter substrate-binding protein [Spirochaetaceae bacterium]|nr:ABC transporter substrate-binding protein [Spirochaetaceae bacterium]
MKYIVSMRMTFAVALVMMLTATGLWATGADEEEPAVAADRETVFDPATGITWTAPEYGGTLTWGANGLPKNTDLWAPGGWTPHLISGVNEKLVHGNWAISRDKVAELAWIYSGPEMYRGALAESWEMPDDTTWIWNIRQGVHYHDKAPMNGREFDAYDVEWNYHRFWGLGDFTEDGPTPNLAVRAFGIELESATATDKWTVELKLTKPYPNTVYLMSHNLTWMLAREVVEQYGDYGDWRNVVGTGPYQLTDLVEDTSATWEKNPNYWGYDEKFPDNRLPYIDTLKNLVIPDATARLAAMRTGKIDMLSMTGDARIFSVDNIESLQKTNPEIEVWPVYAFSSGSHIFNQSVPLMQDVNVRKALQMAVDRETISATFLKGWGDPAPNGIVSQRQVGWNWPYEEWPEEVKAGYKHDPAEAEALLDEAGYPRGADGVRFTLKFGHAGWSDPAYPEVVIAYFDAIGVKSELVVVPGAEMGHYMSTEAHDLHLVNWVGYPIFPPSPDVYRLTSNPWSRTLGRHWSKAKDPEMDALIAEMQATTTAEEWQSLHVQVDEKTVREHWGLVKPISPQFSVTQPWVEGYFGEAGLGYAERNTFKARLWIDSALKAASGR